MIKALIWLSFILIYMTGCYVWELFKEKPVKVKILVLLAYINLYSFILVCFAL